MTYLKNILTAVQISALILLSFAGTFSYADESSQQTAEGSTAPPIPTLAIDLSSLPAKPVWEGKASLIPLAFDENNKPVIIVVKVPAGTTADTAHATSDGRIRFAAVLSGTMYYADGESVNKEHEVAYPSGSILAISSGTKHWLSARQDDVVLLLTATTPDSISPVIKKQLSNQ